MSFDPYSDLPIQKDEQELAWDPYSNLPVAEPASPVLSDESDNLGTFQGFLNTATQVSKDVGQGAIVGVQKLGKNVLELAKPLELESKAEIPGLGSNKPLTARLRENLPATQAPKTKAGAVGELIGSIAPLAAIPGGVGGGMLAKLATSSAAGALAGYLGNPDSVTAPILGAAIGMAGPAGVTGVKLLGRTVGEGKKILQPLISPIKAKEKAIRPFRIDTQAQESAQKTLKAAEDLDLKSPLTPGELTQAPSALADEARLGINTTKVRMRIERILREREQELSTKIKTVIDDIVPEGDEVAAKAAERLYSASFKTNLKPNIKKILDSDENIIDTFETMSRDPVLARKLKSFNTNSVGKYEVMRRVLRERTQEAYKAGETVKAKELETSLKKLTDKLNMSEPVLVQARKISQRIINKNLIKQQLAKIKTEEGADTMTGKFYNAFLSTSKKRLEFIKQAGLAPENRKNVIALARILGSLQKSKIAKLQMMDPAQLSNLGVISAVQHSIIRIIRGEYDDALINAVFIGNKQLSKALSQVTKIKSPIIKAQTLIRVLEDYGLRGSRALGAGLTQRIEGEK